MTSGSKFSKALFFLFSFPCILYGCKSPMDKNADSIVETLEQKENLRDIKLVEIYEDDSLFPYAKDTLVINSTLCLHKSMFDLENKIKEFKSKISGKTNRIWIKTMTPEQAESYENYERAQLKASKAMRAFLSLRNSSTNNKYTLVNIKALQGKTTDNYLGIFYFGNQTDPNTVSRHYLIPMSEAILLSSLYSQSSNGYLPSLEKAGIDVVPADEDPTKTREERAMIKAQQKQLAENKKIDLEITTGIREFVNNMNKGGATQVDEMTTFVKSSLNGHTINIYYNLIADKNNYTSYQWQAFGSMMEQSLKEECQNVLQHFVTNGTPKYKVKEAFNRVGVKWNYVYRDYYGRNLFTVTITPSDLN